MKLNKLRFVQLIEYTLAMLTALPFYLLPPKLAFHIGELFGELLYWIMPRRRQIGYKNLTIAFGDELTEQEKYQILRSNFRNLGKSLVEILHFSKMSKDYLQGKVNILGQENFRLPKVKGEELSI